MIKIFNPTDKVFTSNGDKIIIPTKAKVHKEDNGAYYLDLETNLDYIDDIISGNIIVAPTPQGGQAFRVSNVTVTRKKITAKCYHVFYDTKNYLIEDKYIVDKDCNYALDYLNSSTSDLSPFTTLSNITDINSFRCVRNSLYEAIQTILERWGGHLVRNNFNISILSSIGQDNGVTVEVVDEKLGINITTNIISYEYDCILDKYTQIEFGNFVPTLSGLVSSITNQTQQIVDESTATLQITLGQELENATGQIWDALGNSYVIYEGDKILVVDTLPKEQATNVIMINNGGIGFSNTGINGTFKRATGTQARTIFKITSYTSVADFKNWLSNNNTTVYYVLATPTNTEITDQTLIAQLNAFEKALSYNGETNITTIGNLPIILEASAFMSLKYLFGNLETRVAESEG